MDLTYTSEKVKSQCTSVKAAHKLFGGNAVLVQSLFARIILQPLNESGKPYHPCNIDDISNSVRIVEIMEVSKHYE